MNYKTMQHSNPSNPAERITLMVVFDDKGKEVHLVGEYSDGEKTAIRTKSSREADLKDPDDRPDFLWDLGQFATHLYRQTTGEYLWSKDRAGKDEWLWTWQFFDGETWGWDSEIGDFVIEDKNDQDPHNDHEVA